jgi:hypothetical protein
VADWNSYLASLFFRNHSDIRAAICALFRSEREVRVAPKAGQVEHCDVAAALVDGVTAQPRHLRPCAPSVLTPFAIGVSGM